MSIFRELKKNNSLTSLSTGDVTSDGGDGWETPQDAEPAEPRVRGLSQEWCIRNTFLELAEPEPELAERSRASSAPPRICRQLAEWAPPTAVSSPEVCFAQPICISTPAQPSGFDCVRLVALAAAGLGTSAPFADSSSGAAFGSGSPVRAEAPAEPVADPRRSLRLADALCEDASRLNLAAAAGSVPEPVQPVGPAATLRLAGWLDTASELPSVGSALHFEDQCRPCAFAWRAVGCESGTACTFCHLCAPGEKRRRAKEKKASVAGQRRWAEDGSKVLSSLRRDGERVLSELPTLR